MAQTCFLANASVSPAMPKTIEIRPPASVCAERWRRLLFAQSSSGSVTTMRVVEGTGLDGGPVRRSVRSESWRNLAAALEAGVARRGAANFLKSPETPRLA
jgi:hypothetical protein